MVSGLIEVENNHYERDKWKTIVFSDIGKYVISMFTENEIKMFSGVKIIMIVIGEQQAWVPFSRWSNTQ